MTVHRRDDLLADSSGFVIPPRPVYIKLSRVLLALAFQGRHIVMHPEAGQKFGIPTFKGHVQSIHRPQ
jgi:hypothetical protein